MTEKLKKNKKTKLKGTQADQSGLTEPESQLNDCDNVPLQNDHLTVDVGAYANSWGS